MAQPADIQDGPTALLLAFSPLWTLIRTRRTVYQEVGCHGQKQRRESRSGLETQLL